MNVFSAQAGLKIEDKKDWRRESVTVGATLSGGMGEVLQGSRLGGSSTAGGEFPNMVEEDRALEVVELGGVHGDLGEEGIGHEDRGLVSMAIVGVAQQS